MTMTLSQGYRQAQNAKPHLDYPYLSLPDIEEETIDYDTTKEIPVLGSRRTVSLLKDGVYGSLTMV